VPILAVRSGVRRAIPYALACLVFLPIILVYWPKGYVQIYDGSIAPVPSPWSLDHVALSWRSSTIFTPSMLLLLGVPAIAGVAFLRDWYARLAILMPVVTTAAVYSLYYATYQHPRFLYVALPFVFVLVSTGVISGLRLVWSWGGSLADNAAADPARDRDDTGPAAAHKRCHSEASEPKSKLWWQPI
jgi:hypothetical protein